MRPSALLAAILLFPTLTCCAKIHVRPISVASVAIVCDLPRRYNVVAGTVTAEEVEALKSILDQINAVTPGLVVYAGEISPDHAKAYLEAGAVVVVGAPVRYDVMDPKALEANDGTLAWTSMQTFPGTGCLKGSILAILADLDKIPSPHAAKSVIAHEVLHSIGFGHADPQGSFKTLMTPSLGKETPEGLSAADKRSILAVYSRGFF